MRQLVSLLLNMCCHVTLVLLNVEYYVSSILKYQTRWPLVIRNSRYPRFLKYCSKEAIIIQNEDKQSSYVRVANLYKLSKQVLILALASFLAITCAQMNVGDSENQPLDYSSLYQQYTGTHFIGIGVGTGATEDIAIRIAKAKALGELAESIKVSIMSKLEVITTESIVGDNSKFSESVKDKIISIGKATVRSPEFEILRISSRDTKYHAVVLAKKLMVLHIEESARSLEFEGAGELILKMMTIND